jgi:hypothetical protein
MVVCAYHTGYTGNVTRKTVVQTSWDIKMRLILNIKQKGLGVWLQRKSTCLATTRPSVTTRQKTQLQEMIVLTVFLDQITPRVQ